MALRILHHIRPDHLLHRRLLVVQQPVLDLLAVVFGRHFEAFQVSLEKGLHSVDVFALHGSEARGASLAREMVSRDLSRFRRSGRQRGKPDFIQLQPVKTTMEIPARADGFRQDDAGGVDSLEDSVNVGAARDFLDQ